MRSSTISILGGPAPYREALRLRLESLGNEVIEVERGHEPAVDVDTSVVFIDDDAAWAKLEELIERGPAIAVLDEFRLDDYARAIAAGAGAVHIDTSTQIMCDVIEATTRSEALVPLGVAQELAKGWQPRQSPAQLTALETELGEALVAGATIAALAQQFAYSDRTIRRKLQGLYLKLGASSRAEAIATLARS